MIGRYRGIKPSLFQHGDLFDLEVITSIALYGGGPNMKMIPLRLAYAGLFCWSDREGRFEWKARELKLNILPYDDIDFEIVLRALAKGGFVIRYEVGGKAYGWVPAFTKHQNINNREAASELPAPPPEVIQRAQAAQMLGGFHSYRNEPDSTGESREADASATREGRVTAEVNRSEVNRSEQDQEIVSDSPVHDEMPAASSEGLSERSGEIADIAELDKSIEPQAAPESSGTVLAQRLTQRRVVMEKLPPLPARANVQAVIDRLAAVSSEIAAGTRSRLAKQQERELYAEMVFAYWALKHDHPRSLLDEKRAARIRARLQENDGDVSELFYTLDGALSDKAIQGGYDNDGQKYDGIETIFRDRAQVERLANKRKKYRDGVIHPMIEKYAAAFNGESPLPEANSSDGDQSNGNQ